MKSKLTKSPSSTAEDPALQPSNTGQPATKQNTVLSLLRRSEGATIACIMETTGWQAHSVRGFLAGTVRKKLGLSLTSHVDDGQRVYRIAQPQPPKMRSPRKRTLQDTAAQA